MYRYLIIFALMLALSGSVQGQRPANTTQPVRNQVPTAPLIEPIVQVGHATGIRYLAFTPDERYLLSNDYGKTILWEINTGRKVGTFEEHEALRGHFSGRRVACLLEDNKTLFTIDEEESRGDTVAVFWDIHERKKRKSFNLPPSKYKLPVAAVSADGLCFVTSYEDDVSDTHSVRLWNVETGKLLREFIGHTSYIHTIIFSPKGDYIVSSGDGVIVWDVKTGRKLYTINSSEDKWATPIQFSSDGSKLLIRYRETLRLLDMKTGRHLDHKLNEYISRECVILLPDGESIAITGEERLLTIRDVQTFNVKSSSDSGHVEQIGCMALSRSGRLLATGGWDGTIFIREGVDGKIIQRLGDSETGSAIRSDFLHIIPNAAMAFIFNNTQTVSIWNLKMGTYKVHIDSTSTLQSIFSGEHYLLPTSWLPVGNGKFVPSETRYSIHGRGEGGLLYRENDNTIVGWSGANMFFWDATDLSQQGVTTYSGLFYAIALSPDNRQMIAYASKDDGYMYLVLLDCDGKEIGIHQRIDRSRGSDSSLEWHDNDQVVLIVDGTSEDEYFANKRTHYRWNLKSNMISKEEKEQEIESVIVRPSDDRIIYLDSQIILPGKMVIANKGIVFYTMSDGSTRLFHKDTGEELCSLYSFGDGTDWLVITPQGLFDGSPGGRRMVSYRVGKGLNVQPVEAFFQDFYYPGLLAAIWAGERPMPSATLKEQMPPEIQFVTPSQAGEVRGDKTSFEVLITDQGGGIQKPYVTLNGTGILVRTAPVASGKTQRWKFDLQLTEGDNTIVIHSATADGQIACKSMPLVLHSIQREIVTPSLYVLAVGISDYQDGKDNDLPCARRDAEVLAEVFKRRGTEFYGVGKVHIRTLVDSQATTKGIQQAMQEIAAAAKPQDLFVLMLSGHGATVGQRYFFLPHEFKFAGDTRDNLIVKQGIANDVLSDWIKGINALKRVLIYDTCQSGAVVTRSGMEHRKAMEDLANKTGCYTIAAAAGKEYANELPDVGHGALTYALLAGMGEAKTGFLRDRNVIGNDGNVRVLDLFTFAYNEVPKLTNISFGTEQRVVFSVGENNYSLLGKP